MLHPRQQKMNRYVGSFFHMSAFGGIQPRARRSKWGPPEEKTLMPNVATIIPPGLKPEILHSLLLRFQFEEIQYKLDHLFEETSYVLCSDPRNQTIGSNITPDVRARDQLVNERRQVIDSIEKIYPAFMPPLSIRYSVNKIVERVEIREYQLIGIILGARASNINDMERQYNVKISLRPSFVKVDKGLSDGSYALIIGTRQDDVRRCSENLKRLLSTADGEMFRDNDEVDPSEFSIDFDPTTAAPPWIEDMPIRKRSETQEVDQAISEIMKGVGNVDNGDDHPILSQDDLLKMSIDLSWQDIGMILKEAPVPGA